MPRINDVTARILILPPRPTLDAVDTSLARPSPKRPAISGSASFEPSSTVFSDASYRHRLRRAPHDGPGSRRPPSSPIARAVHFLHPRLPVAIIHHSYPFTFLSSSPSGFCTFHRATSTCRVVNHRHAHGPILSIASTLHRPSSHVTRPYPPAFHNFHCLSSFSWCALPSHPVALLPPALFIIRPRPSLLAFLSFLALVLASLPPLTAHAPSPPSLPLLSSDRPLPPPSVPTSVRGHVYVRHQHRHGVPPRIPSAAPTPTTRPCPTSRPPAIHPTCTLPAAAATPPRTVARPVPSLRASARASYPPAVSPSPSPYPSPEPSNPIHAHRILAFTAPSFESPSISIRGSTHRPRKFEARARARLRRPQLRVESESRLLQIPYKHSRNPCLESECPRSQTHIHV
ncbi:hypothetical protein DFH09DRAFT_1319812 [Mycena vulgaris]|nr:hypothetical protein DFH09DRAFT_1319812 [Mycena vulgaris]